ncbi:MAG: hypothetical protein Q4G35_04700 [Propionibacteriaceae bacterium]|nr:hypothetical protein [Propionibacteriaceae bacterium]
MLAWVLGGCAAVAVVFIVIVVAVVVGAIQAVREDVSRTPRPQPSAASSPERLRWEDRPRWGELVEKIERYDSHYLPLIRSGEIYNLVPQGEAVGKDYIEAFRLTYVDMISAWKFGGLGGESRSTLGLEMDDRIDGSLQRIAELERKLLAGEHLGVSWAITGTDNVRRVYDGRNPALDQPPPPPPEPEPTVEADASGYEFVRAQQPWLDDAGTYTKAGEELAAAFGIRVSYSFEEMVKHCPSSKNYADWAGAFCGNTPSTIYIPLDIASHSYYPGFLADHTYLDVVRHEIAHSLIFDTCGTFAPAIAGDLYEGMTNSYAVLYLGANRDELFVGEMNGYKYAMTDQTDSLAQAVHAGNCT